MSEESDHYWKGVAVPAELQRKVVQLQSDPAKQTDICLIDSTLEGDLQPIVVFIHGRDHDQATWLATICKLLDSYKEKRQKWPTLLTYRRFTEQSYRADPAVDGDSSGTETTASASPFTTYPKISSKDPYHYKFSNVLQDLHELVGTVKEMVYSSRARPSKVPLILVSNSLGGPIARLYAQTHPGTVIGLVFLDCAITNTDHADDVYPDPDGPDFDANRDLPDDTTVDKLRQVLQRARKEWTPNLPNDEGLDTRDLKSLLPHSDSPKLQAPYSDKGPFVTAVLHDPVSFAKKISQYFDIPIGLLDRYGGPTWLEYTQGLTRLTDKSRARGPLTKDGVGHLVQDDDPQYVAELLSDMIRDVLAS